MRHAPAWFAAMGGVLVWLATPAPVHAANVWVTLAAGLPGATTPANSTEFHFDNPHAPNIAVTELAGGISAEAVTGGGTTYFGGLGAPVLLNLADGSAYIASGSAPPAAKTGGAGGGTAASAAPAPGGSMPTNAALLGINLAESNNGSRTLFASVTDAGGNPLASGSVDVPDGGWWVIGLGPVADPVPPPPIDPPPPVDPLPEPQPSSPPPAAGGAVGTPEPATLVMAVLGGSALCAWRRGRGRAC